MKYFGFLTYPEGYATMAPFSEPEQALIEARAKFAENEACDLNQISSWADKNGAVVAYRAPLRGEEE